MNKIWISIILILLATNVYALRVARPFTLKYPINEEQISQLNKFLEEIQLMQQGRYEMDIVTSPKTNANNGEMWLINTGGIIRLQWKGNGIIWTNP